MREDVLSLKAMGGDPVSEEYLKADLYHRAEALKDIPDTPLFFGRLDYAAGERGRNTETGIFETGISGTGQADDGETAWPGTASISAAGTCTPRTGRPR